MKIFLSWSGQQSHKVAILFRDWLPSVLQCVVPYVSSEDIDKGARWSTDIASELEASSFGILFITPDNVDAPWLNFEAGALSKAVNTSRVCPFLFSIKRADVKGPLLQFQSTISDKSEVKKLIISINSACEDSSLEEARLENIFEVWWPKLKEQLDALKDHTEQHSLKKVSDNSTNEKQDQYLEEILELTRSQQRLINSPEKLLPPEYLHHILKRSKSTRSTPRRHSMAIRDVIEVFHEMRMFLMTHENELTENEGLVPLSVMRDFVERLGKPVNYLQREEGMREDIIFSKPQRSKSLRDIVD